MSFQDRWGYKGTETGLNGLTKWLQLNFEWKGGSSTDQYNRQLRLIERYGKEVLGLTLRGHLVGKAVYVSKKMNKKYSFKKFTEWVNMNAIADNPLPAHQLKQ